MSWRATEQKELAAAAHQTGHHRFEAALYDQIAEHDANPLWRHRAGEAFLHAGDEAEALVRFLAAADGFVAAHHPRLAIASCRMVLALRPTHVRALWMLARSQTALDGTCEMELTDEALTIVDGCES